MNEEILRMPINYNELLSNMKVPHIFSVTPKHLIKNNIMLSEDSSNSSNLVLPG